MPKNKGLKCGACGYWKEEDCTYEKKPLFRVISVAEPVIFGIQDSIKLYICPMCRTVQFGGEL